MDFSREPSGAGMPHSNLCLTSWALAAFLHPHLMFALRSPPRPTLLLPLPVNNKRQSGFPGGSVVKTVPAVQGTRVQSLRQKDPLEKGEATQSSMPAWTIPQTEGPGELQSMGSTQSDATERLTLSLSYLLLQPPVMLACTGEPLTFTTALPSKTTPFLLTHSFLCVCFLGQVEPARWPGASHLKRFKQQSSECPHARGALRQVTTATVFPWLLFDFFFPSEAAFLIFPPARATGCLAACPQLSLAIPDGDSERRGGREPVCSW